jgi:predicted aldo/keto reductase-like oxidoreductase
MSRLASWSLKVFWYCNGLMEVTALKCWWNEVMLIWAISGMDTMEQVLDNTSYMSDFKALNEEEYKVIEK